MSDEIKATEAEVPQEQAAAVEVKEPSLPADYKPLSTALRFFYGVGDFGFNIMNSVENYYFVFFLTNCAMLDPVLAGIVSTVGSVIDAIVGWLWGAIINTIKPMRWGRYRSFLFIMPWAVPILFALDYVKFSDNPVITAVLITIFYVASHCTWDFPYVANVSMIAVVGQTPEDRAHLASTRGMWSNASKILFAYIFPPVAMVGAMLLGNQNTDPSAAPANYAFAAFVFGCVMAALYNVHFFITKGYEKEYTKEELANWKAAKKEDKTNNSAGDLGRSIASNPNVIFLMLGDVAKWIFNFVVGGTAVYYFTYVAFNPGMLATYIFATNVGTVVGAYLGGPVSKALKGSKKAVIAAFIVMIAMLLISRAGWLRPHLRGYPRDVRRLRRLLRVEDRQELRWLDFRPAGSAPQDRLLRAWRCHPRHPRCSWLRCRHDRRSVHACPARGHRQRLVRASRDPLRYLHADPHLRLQDQQ